MCGIVGYAGHKQAAPILLDGLAKLEYRGYDSAGICVYNDHKLPVFKAKGRLSNLSQMVHGGADVPGVIGIGHTRWATHGAPSDANSHPHTAAGGKIVVVHNGIIENYQQLKERPSPRRRIRRTSPISLSCSTTKAAALPTPSARPSNASRAVTPWASSASTARIR